MIYRYCHKHTEQRFHRSYGDSGLFDAKAVLENKKK